MEEKIFRKFNSISEIKEEGLELLFSDELVSLNLKELMDQRMVSVENIASAIDTTTQTVYQFLNNPGNVKIKDLARISTVLGVTLDELVNIDKEKWYRRYPSEDGQFFLDLKTLEVISYNEKFARRKADEKTYFSILENKCITQKEYTEMKNLYIKKKKEEAIKKNEEYLKTKEGTLAKFNLQETKAEFDKIYNTRYPFLVYKSTPPNLNIDISKYGL